jgi:hypothetical protein
MVVVNWLGGEGGAGGGVGAAVVVPCPIGAGGGGGWFWDGGKAFVVARELCAEVPATEQPPPGEP